VFEIADRIHIQRLGRRVAVVRSDEYSMAEVVAIMTGALTIAQDETHAAVVVDEAAASAVGVTQPPAGAEGNPG
jgi:fructose transport system ATP-binding protein